MLWTDNRLIAIRQAVWLIGSVMLVACQPAASVTTPTATVAGTNTPMPTVTNSPTDTPSSTDTPQHTDTPSSIEDAPANEADTANNPPLTRHTLTHDGEHRIYYLHVPDIPLEPAPVVFVFQGNGQTSQNISLVTGLSALADEAGFIAVYPDALGGYGLYATIPEVNVDDLGFLRAILATLADQYSIDPARIYATGNSNGAFFAQRVACEMADEIAAVASVSGTMPESLVEGCQPERPVPMMLIHGTDDFVVPFNGQPERFLSVPDTFDLWRSINGCDDSFITAEMPDRANDGMRVQQFIANQCTDGSEVVLIAVKGGGHAWPGGNYGGQRRATQDINATVAMWEFFQAHPNP